jgi:O-antigen/teichoic acid export membrane protein
MSRTHRLLTGAAVYYAGQIVMLLVGLWVTRFTLACLGEHDLGLWLEGLQILGYLSLLDLGVVAVIPRATAAASGQREQGGFTGRVQTLLGRAAWIVAGQTLLAGVLAWAAWLALPDRLAAFRVEIGLVLAAYVAYFPSRIFQAVLTGLQDFSFLNLIQMGVWAVNTGLNVGLLVAGFRLSALAWGWVASQAALHLACALRLWWRHPDLLPRHLPRPHRAEVARHFHEGVWFSLSNLAVALVQGTDLIIIGRILGPEAVVVYGCTGKLVQVFGNYAQAILQMSLPALTEVRVSQPPERTRATAETLTLSQMLLTGAVCCVILAVNPSFVTFWVGAERYGGHVLTILLVLVLLLRHWNLTAVFSLFSYSRDRRIVLTTLADGLVTVVGTVAFTALGGWSAAPLGSLLGVCSVSLPLNVRAVTESFGVPLTALMPSLGQWVWRFVVAGVACSLLGISQVSGRFTVLMTVAAAATAIYGLLMLPLLRRPPIAHVIRLLGQKMWARFPSLASYLR